MSPFARSVRVGVAVGVAVEVSVGVKLGVALELNVTVPRPRGLALRD